MIEQLRPAAFMAWLSEQSATPVVLDVREPIELAQASVKALANAQAFEVVAMPMQSIPQKLSQLPQDRPIVCLCHHGMRSQQVAMFLRQQGFDQVLNFAGGIDAWSCELDTSVARY